VAESPDFAPACIAEERTVPQAISNEIQQILDRADEAIACSRALVEQRQKLAAASEEARRRQELRNIFSGK
jgi:hypothetical protein